MEHKCNKSDVKPIEKCELNLKQVIKALEWCSSGGNCIKCAENVKNPRLSKEGCMAVQIRNAVALIKELTEENERLRKALCREDITIVRARANGKSEYQKELIRIKVGAIIADTVRKMHSEIKDRCIKGGIYPAFVARTIDQIAKEMVEG